MSILSVIKSAVTKVFGSSEPDKKASGNTAVNTKNTEAILTTKEQPKQDMYVGKKDSDLTGEEKDAIRMQIEEKLVSIEKRLEKLSRMNKKPNEEEIQELKEVYQNVKNELKNKGMIEKLQLISSLDSALEEQLILIQQDKINKKANKADILNRDAHNKFRALNSGAFDSLEEADKYNKKSKLHKDKAEIEKMSPKEREAYFTALMEEENTAIEAKVAKLPREKQEAERKRLQAQSRYNKESFMIDAAYTKTTQYLLNIVQNLGPQVFDTYSESIGFGLNTRKAGEARTEAADMQDFDYHTKMKQNYLSCGKSVSSKDFGNGIQMTACSASLDGLNNLNNGINAARQRAKETGELPAGISRDDLTEASAGVGAGATVNQNISTEDKAKFLNNFERELQKYDDYKEVMNRVESRVQEYLSTLPPAERKQIEEQIKQIKTKCAELKAKEKTQKQKTEKEDKKIIKQKNEPQKPTRIYSEQKVPKGNYAKLPEQNNDVKQEENKDEKNTIAQKHSVSSKKTLQNQQTAGVIAKKETDNRTLAVKIVKSVDAAIEETSLEEVAHEVFTNPALASQIPIVASKFKGQKDVDYLQRVTIGCSNRAYLCLLRVLSPDVAGKLYDKTNKQRGYDMAKLGENIVKSGKDKKVKHAVA